MARLHIPQHLFVCRVDGRHVFLDLAQDRYFALPPDLDAGFARFADEVPTACGCADMPPCPPPPFLAGILPLAPAGTGKPLTLTHHPAPERSFVEEQDIPSPRLADIVEATLLVAGSKRTVSTRRLPEAVARLAGWRNRGVAADSATRDRLVGRFLAARRYVPIAPNCLRDSLALCGYLARRGIAPDLVIGVKLDPFAAHSWVQDGSTVLNETVGGAAIFTPLLVA